MLRALRTLWLAKTTYRPMTEGGSMAKKARKRRTRRKNKANHGKRPNAGRK